MSGINPQDLRVIMDAGFSLGFDIERNSINGQPYLEVCLIGPGFDRVLINSTCWDTGIGDDYKLTKLGDVVKQAAMIVKGLLFPKAAELREPLIDFALAMEQRLAVHDDDRGPDGWRRMPNTDRTLLSSAAAAFDSLDAAVKTGEDLSIERFATDLANFAMMLRDRAALRDKAMRHGRTEASLERE